MSRHSRRDENEKAWTMNRNKLYAVIAALVVASLVLGYLFYKERQKPTGIEIKINDNGMSIDQK